MFLSVYTKKPLEGVSPEPKATHLVSPTAWQRGFAEASHHEGHILPKLRRGRNIYPDRLQKW